MVMITTGRYSCNWIAILYIIQRTASFSMAKFPLCCQVIHDRYSQGRTAPSAAYSIYRSSRRWILYIPSSISLTHQPHLLHIHNAHELWRQLDCCGGAALQTTRRYIRKAYASSNEGADVYAGLHRARCSVERIHNCRLHH